MTEEEPVIEFMQLIMDFITLGAIGFFATITLLIWISFCEVFIFEQGYFRCLRNYRVVKALLVLISGIIIWGSALCKVHDMLWNH